MEELTAKQQKERYWAEVERNKSRHTKMRDISEQTYKPSESELLDAAKLVLPTVINFDEFDYFYLELEEYKALCVLCDGMGIKRQQ